MPKIYEVGGCVRDELLGFQSKDIDFTFVLDDLSKTVEEGFQEMTQYLEDKGFEIFLSTPECFTIRAKFPEDHEMKGLVADFVMSRKESGHIEGTRRAEFELGSLYDDLERRDFTMNAIAKDPNGHIHDPFGGQIDLKENVIDTTKDPYTTLIDDPLRMIRAIRFSITKSMKISPGLWNAMGQNELIDRLEDTVSGERIRDEFNKAFSANTLETIKMLARVDQQLPGLLEVCFDSGLDDRMWLKPTFKKKKA